MQEPGQSDRDRPLGRYSKRFGKGEVLYREGDRAVEAYLLQEGRVRLVRRVRGAERSLMVLRPSELFGETALLDGAKRTSTALAVTDGSVLALDQGTFRRLLETNSMIALRVVQQLVRRLRDAEDQIEIMMLRDTRSKVVSALIKLTQAIGAPAGRPCMLSVSPLDLSTRVGLEVEAVRRTVQHLREGQYLRVVDEQIEIPDLESLERLYALLTLKEEIRGPSDSPDA